MSLRKKSIGFPDPLLGSNPIRLDIIDNTKYWIAINKPSNIASRQHLWNKGYNNLDSALNFQLKQRKPEIVSLNADKFSSIYNLDYLISGIALYSKSHESLNFLRNAFGSDQISFNYYFVAKNLKKDFNSRLVEFPLKAHKNKCRMIPSKKGKNSHTKFIRLKDGIDNWSLFEAKTNYFRPHQIRIHASLIGLQIMNEPIYNGIKAPTLAMLGKSKKTSDISTNIFSDLALHLGSIKFPSILDQKKIIEIQAPISKSLKTVYKYLKLL